MAISTHTPGALKGRDVGGAEYGYGVFSYSKSHISRVINYIQNQEEHHRKKTFKEEYIKILEDFEVKYDEKYLFKWISEKEEGDEING